MVYGTGKHCKKVNKNKVFVKSFPEKLHKESEYGGVSQQVIEDEKILLKNEKNSATITSIPIVNPSSAHAVDEWDDWNDII